MENNENTRLLPLIGYRKDRLGARLTTLVNVIRLSGALDVQGKYWWLSQPNGENSDLSDPTELFSAGFIEEWLHISDREPPDLQQRYNLTIESGKSNVAQIRKSISQGGQYWTEDGFSVIQMIDEDRKVVARQFQDAFSRIEFSSTVASRLDEISIQQKDREPPTAFHIRRGDILTDSYWSAKSWAAKYVPDEFFSAAAEEIEGPIVAFTDTPGALEHLRNTQPHGERIFPVYNVFEHEGCSRAQKDLLELLILARSKKIYSPIQSAFSTAASLLSGSQVVALPAGLNRKVAVRAYDKLLERTINHPEHFYCAGDFAQSLDFAAMHAIGTGRTKELFESLNKVEESTFLNHPFLYRIASELAAAVGDVDAAHDFAQRSKKSKSIWPSDKMALKAIDLLLRKRKDPESLIVMKDFCGFIFEKNYGNLHAKSITSMVAEYSKNDEFCKAFSLVNGELDILTLTVANSGNMIVNQANDGETKVAPIWSITTDWIDLIKNERGRRKAMTEPSFFPRFNAFSPEIHAVQEEVLASGVLPSDQSLKLSLGRIASTYSLFGRYRKALTILDALTREDASALDLKRQADLHYRIKHNDKALTYLKMAVEKAPDCYALHLSFALGLARSGDFKMAKTQIQIADKIWPECDLTDITNKQIMKIRKGLSEV